MGRGFHTRPSLPRNANDHWIGAQSGDRPGRWSSCDERFSAGNCLAIYCMALHLYQACPMLHKKSLAIGIPLIVFALASMNFLPSALDAVALRKAEELCAGVKPNDAPSSFQSKAALTGAELTVTEDAQGISHYQGWFSGFLGNTSVCNVFTRDGVVLSKHAEQHLW